MSLHRLHGLCRAITRSILMTFMQSSNACWRKAPNSALLTDAYSSLRCACGAAKRER